MNTWRGKGGNDIRREKRGGKGYRKEKEKKKRKMQKVGKTGKRQTELKDPREASRVFPMMHLSLSLGLASED